MKASAENQTQRRVMLIDDEEPVLFALRLLMEALGFRVDAFSRGKTALEVLASDPLFDFILCDLRMPEMNGLEVLSAIKEICPSPKRVLISGHASNAEIDSAKRIGIHGFLGKPFTADELKALLE